jgi:hypothetical protein
MVEHRDPDVVAHCSHRSGRRPLGDGGGEPSHHGDRGEDDHQRTDASRDLAVGDEIGETVRQCFGLHHDGDRRHRSDDPDDDQVRAQRGDEPDQPDVDRAAPVDVAHRWTIGRCWVPMRLRKTQYVQPWYSNTTGVMTSATIVITFKV